MNILERAWDRMTQAERIVAMSLVAGGIIGIINSTVWAVATCFISYQRTRVRMASVEAKAYERLAGVKPEHIGAVSGEE